MAWLKDRRKQLNLTQEDVAARLALHGNMYSTGMVSHWETGRYSPPMESPEFRVAMASVLKVSERELLEMAGYDVSPIRHTSQGEKAAWLIDQMDDEKRRMALGILEVMAGR